MATFYTCKTRDGLYYAGYGRLTERLDCAFPDSAKTIVDTVKHLNDYGDGPVEIVTFEDDFWANRDRYSKLIQEPTPICRNSLLCALIRHDAGEPMFLHNW